MDVESRPALYETVIDEWKTQVHLSLLPWGFIRNASSGGKTTWSRLEARVGHRHDNNLSLAHRMIRFLLYLQWALAAEEELALFLSSLSPVSTNSFLFSEV